MYGARCGLQVGEDVLAEEVDNIDKDIGGGDTKLSRDQQLHSSKGSLSRLTC